VIFDQICIADSCDIVPSNEGSREIECRKMIEIWSSQGDDTVELLTPVYVN
jgi:hypothetical protein